MATYTIQTRTDGPDWPDDPSFQFKYRRSSKDGHPCAQAVFDKLKQEGAYARMMRWENGEATTVETHIPPAVRNIAQRFKKEAYPLIRKRTVPLFSIEAGQVFVERSGVLLRIANEYFVLTAAHGMKERIEEKKTPMFIGGGPGIKPAKLDGAAYYWTDENSLDVAVIKLPASVAEVLRADYEPISLRDIDTSFNKTPAYFVIYGYPNQFFNFNATSYSIGTFAYSTLFYEGQRKDDPFERFEYSPSYHFLLDMNRKSYRGGSWAVERLPKVEGMRGISGCGVWRMANFPHDPALPWTPAGCKLVGIEHRLKMDDGYAISTWIDYALKVLFETHPQLQRATDLILPN